MIDPSTLTYLSSGTNRDVYLLPGGKYVLKVPRNENGIADNYWEAAIDFHKDAWSKKIRVNARCRLIPGTTLLVMEYVEPATTAEVKHRLNLERMPEWTDFIDCQQVGFTRSGKLKAYDYGLR
jgi:hypothetical protein